MPPKGSKYIRYLKIAGLGGIPLISLFLYLTMVGIAETTGYSYTENCAGRGDDLCYLYWNVTFHNDTYIQQHSQWLNTTPPVKSIKLQRSWGKSWRTIDLSKTWSKRVKYAVLFHKYQPYELRFVAEKFNPRDVINWSINPNGTWGSALAEYSCDYETITKIKEDHIFEKELHCEKINKTHLIPKCYMRTIYVRTDISKYNVTKCIPGTNKIDYIESSLYYEREHKCCWITRDAILCDDDETGDGNGDCINDSGEHLYEYVPNISIDLKKVSNGIKDVSIKYGIKPKPKNIKPIITDISIRR